MMKNKEIEQKYLKIIEELNKKYGATDEWSDIVDNEGYHGEWDELITNFIKELGYKKIAKEYEKADRFFWYA